MDLCNRGSYLLARGTVVGSNHVAVSMWERRLIQGEKIPFIDAESAIIIHAIGHIMIYQVFSSSMGFALLSAVLFTSYLQGRIQFKISTTCSDVERITPSLQPPLLSRNVPDAEIPSC